VEKEKVKEKVKIKVKVKQSKRRRRRKRRKRRKRRRRKMMMMMRRMSCREGGAPSGHPGSRHHQSHKARGKVRQVRWKKSEAGQKVKHRGSPSRCPAGHKVGGGGLGQQMTRST
jgi:hypothetical protein